MVQLLRCRVGVSRLDYCFPVPGRRRSRLAPLQARRAAASASNGARRRLDLGLGTPSQVPLAHLTGRRRWCGVPENVSRANLIDAHEPTVASDIGGQDRDEPAFDPTLPWYADGCRPLFCNADDGEKRTFCRETMLFWMPSAPLLGGSAELFILFFILLR